jgi:hypothetical protein
MKSSWVVRSHYYVFVAVSLVIASPALRADVFLSNLGNHFPLDGIGDIHNLFPGSYSFTACFTTGDAAFTLNAVTLELYDDRTLFAPNSWTNLSLRLYEALGSQKILLGELGSPTINPTPTQWPIGSTGPNGPYTTYVDFHPVQGVELGPFMQCLVQISDPPASPSSAGLLFSFSSQYTTPTDWGMNPTVSGSPTGEGNGEFLKLAVDATEVPEPSSVGLTLIYIAALTLGRLGLSAWSAEPMQATAAAPPVSAVWETRYP